MQIFMSGFRPNTVCATQEALRGNKIARGGTMYIPEFG